MMSCKTQIWVGLEGARPRTITLDQVQELRPHHIGRASASGWLGFRGLAGVRACVLALTLQQVYCHQSEVQRKPKWTQVWKSSLDSHLLHSLF